MPCSQHVSGRRVKKNCLVRATRAFWRVIRNAVNYYYYYYYYYGGGGDDDDDWWQWYLQ